AIWLISSLFWQKKRIEKGTYNQGMVVLISDASWCKARHSATASPCALNLALALDNRNSGQQGTAGSFCGDYPHFT
ncbi:hypothetical protein ACNQ1D_26470, partial [Enterobacter cloacae complex sp.6700005]|uniref:hypothetical protein n=1 Tax=Enterobacter cloacae complex sp.6700005 TaxID=3397180 RepID=UPI003AAE10FE